MHFAKKQSVRVSIETEVQIVSQGTITLKFVVRPRRMSFPQLLKESDLLAHSMAEPTALA